MAALPGRKCAVEIREDLFGIDFVSPQQGWIVGARGAILHTKDGGQTWQAQRADTFSWLEDVRFTNEKHGVAVGSSGTILRTEDGGETWKRVDRNLKEWLYALDLCRRSARIRGWSAGYHSPH